MNKRLISIIMSALLVGVISAETPLHYEGELLGTVGKSDSGLAPYYIMSNNGGVVTQSKTMNFRAKAWKDLDLSRRFSYSFGADFITGASSEVDYLHYDVQSGEMQPIGRKPAAIWLQQLYAEVKYRGVFLMAGMKERTSPLLNSSLGVGDFIQSNNARPVPEVRVVFVDFQDIPFTNGWVQIQGEISYGKYVQDDWLEDHYSYYGHFINTGVWTHYKRCYFRTKPSQPFSVTVGMQMYAQFGGNARTYDRGELIKEDPYDVKFKDLVDIFLPTRGGKGDNKGDSQYYYGNSLGSWDFVARYRFHDDTQLKAYFQWPYEDGSGIGKLNGFDGIWGLEYQNKDKKAIVANAVIEYIDFTNQSGPTHWAPADNPDSDMKGEATGGDSYYNNFRYNSFMNFGMSQGTPFIPSTIYNQNGYLKVFDNRIRGFHAGVSGCLLDNLDYRFLVSYRKSWGSYDAPRLEKAKDTSFMLEASYAFNQVKGLSLKGQFAMDRGNLLGDSYGVLVSLKYDGILNLFGK